MYDLDKRSPTLAYWSLLLVPRPLKPQLITSLSVLVLRLSFEWHVLPAVPIDTFWITHSEEMILCQETFPIPFLLLPHSPQ